MPSPWRMSRPEVISGCFYLSWPLTDKEREAGDYSKAVLPRGQIYRIKARAWKGMPSANPSGMSRRYWRKAYLVRHWRRSLGGIYKAHSSEG